MGLKTEICLKHYVKWISRLSMPWLQQEGSWNVLGNTYNLTVHGMFVELF